VAHKDNTQHFTGVALFCFGSFVYSVALLRLGRESHKHLALQHLALELFLFVSSGALLVAFILLWIEEENSGRHAKQDASDAYTSPDQKAYIVEHCAYIAHLLFYAAFFAFHTPDPMYQPTVASVYEAEMMVEMNTLNPLIPVTIEVQ
jgi:hypothetical protein